MDLEYSSLRKLMKRASAHVDFNKLGKISEYCFNDSVDSFILSGAKKEKEIYTINVRT